MANGTAQRRTRSSSAPGGRAAAAAGLPASQSLAGCYPELARDWHPTKNGTLTPRDMAPGSTTSVWWKCRRGPDHEWQASPSRRTRGGQPRACPFCAGQRVSVTNSLAKRFPAIAKQWHPTKNGSLRPDDVVAGSLRRVWWQCPKGADHEWATTVGSRTRGAGAAKCPFCVNQRVSKSNNLARTAPKVATQWHPTKNGRLTPEQVVAGSTRLVWWKCAKGPDHEWRAQVYTRAMGEAECPFCAGKRLSVTNALAARHPGLARQWHPTKNGSLTPKTVRAGATSKLWWKCPKGPDHEWQATVAKRVSRRQGCPCCSGQQVSVTNSLATRYPELAKEWHPTKNRGVTPDDVVAHSTRYAWWTCPEDPSHEYRAACNTRAQGSRCPICLESRGERAVRRALKQAGCMFKERATLPGLRHPVSGRPVVVDFYLPRKKVVIEFDGPQHVPPPRPARLTWGRPSQEIFEEIRLSDRLKNRYCRKRGLKMIRIPHGQLERVPEIVDRVTRRIGRTG